MMKNRITQGQQALARDLHTTVLEVPGTPVVVTIERPMGLTLRNELSLIASILKRAYADRIQTDQAYVVPLVELKNLP